jgi:hypothetical protein
MNPLPDRIARNVDENRYAWGVAGLRVAGYGLSRCKVWRVFMECVAGYGLGERWISGLVSKLKNKIKDLTLFSELCLKKLYS